MARIKNMSDDLNIFYVPTVTVYFPFYKNFVFLKIWLMLQYLCKAESVLIIIVLIIGHGNSSLILIFLI